MGAATVRTRLNASKAEAGGSSGAADTLSAGGNWHGFGLAIHDVLCGERLMSFLLFFRGLIGVLVVFAVTTYFITHSISTALIDTLICGVLIQLGYFIAVLFLVWRTPTGQAGNDSAVKSEPTRANMAGKPARRLSNTSRSRHS